MNFTYYLNIFVVFSIVLTASSCDYINEEDAITTSISKAEKFLKKNPDSTLNIANRLLKNKSYHDLSKKYQIAIFQLKQQAFSNLSNMDSVLVTGIKIRSVASKISDSLAIAKSLLPVKGEIDFSHQQEIEPYFISSINFFNKNKMFFESAKLSASYGAILCHKGDFVNAQSFLLKSYHFFNKQDSIKPLINICMNIGSTYSYSKNIKKSLEYYNKSYEAAIKLKDSISISAVLMNIGTYYADDLKDQNKALRYYERASRYIPQKSGDFLKMQIDYNTATAYFTKGDLTICEKTYQSMLSDCINKKAYEGVAMASKGLGDLYAKKNQPKKALPFTTKAIHLADSLGMSYEALEMRPSLLNLYKKTNNYKAALLVSEQMKTMNDSILSADKQKAVSELEIKYQTEKKAIEIANLKEVSKSHQIMLYGLSIFVIVLFFVLRRQNRLYQEKQHSYALLMQKYKDERVERLNKLDENYSIESKITAVSSEKNNELYTNLINFYEKEKPYLNPKLKAVDVAKEFQVPQRVISVILKENGFSGFNNFNNKYRVAEVKRIFEDKKFNMIKMEVIARQAGFGNKQTFYTAFEEFTGLNPGYYRTEILK